jgi:NADPH2:quinone reductase
MPLNMRFIEIENPGQDYLLSIAETEIPAVGNNDVLIRVGAAGVNRADLQQCKGLYPPPAGASTIPGMEVCGTVVETGSFVERPKVGDRVCTLVTGGGYAEYCVAHAELCLPVPERLTDVEGAALPEALFTVWDALYRRAQLKSGESLLVHGGTSGIGTTAIQLASELGATVFTTAGTAEKCEACLKLGAKLAINYREQDFVSEIHTALHDHGVDVILDIVGAEYFARNIQVLANEGRLLQISVQSGSQVDLDLTQIMRKRISIHGATLRSRSSAEKRLIAEDLLKVVWPMLEAGAFNPVIAGTFPYSNAMEAHRFMASSTHIGKIVLVND